MSQVRIRQVARLEKLAQPHIERSRQTKEQWQALRMQACAHAAIFAFLIRYGNPAIDEPLSCAWQRCSESSEWIESCRRFPCCRPICWSIDAKYPFEPDSPISATVIGGPLRHVIIAGFPGADEKDKLDLVFASAPPWLIWSTFADYTAELLGLTLPDLSSVRGFARSKASFDLWCGFPSGAFERRPWPHGPDNEPLARTDLKLLRPEIERADKQMTPRERTRATYMKSQTIKCADDWPELIPEEWFETVSDQMVADGQLHRSLSGRDPNFYDTGIERSHTEGDDD
jgi:hypothetical protein